MLKLNTEQHRSEFTSKYTVIWAFVKESRPEILTTLELISKEYRMAIHMVIHKARSHLFAALLLLQSVASGSRTESKR